MHFSGEQTILIGICFFILGVVGTILAIKPPYDCSDDDLIDHVIVCLNLRCKYCGEELDFAPMEKEVSPGQLYVSMKVGPCGCTSSTRDKEV